MKPTVANIAKINIYGFIVLLASVATFAHFTFPAVGLDLALYVFNVQFFHPR
jgi:hypothetical protein